MPRPRLPNLHREVSRHGKTVWYYRRGSGPRIRVRGEYGSAEFLASYEAARGGESVRRAAVADRGTLGWLISCYHGSAAWAALSVATRSQRENIFRKVLGTAGDIPLARIDRRTIGAGIDRRRATPFAANDFLKAMRALFRWGQSSGHVDVDPTEGVRGFGHKTEGFHCWTDEEIERFETHWPIGTRERLALALLLYTGLRRGDVVKVGRQHVRDGVIVFRAEKTGTAVTIPVLPELALVINASRTGDLAFIATASGHPMPKESFGTWFAVACKAAGVPGRAHGLRKAGATRAANNGATVAQLEAIFGWHGGRMAALYTRGVDRARLAREAIGKLRK